MNDRVAPYRADDADVNGIDLTHARDARSTNDPWGEYRPSDKVDIVSFPHGVAAFVVHGDPVPRSLWDGARLLWWHQSDTLHIAFKRYDGPLGAPRYIVLAEVSRSLHRCIAALRAHRVIDVFVIDRNSNSQTGSHEDVVLFAAVHP